jgi:hypothetical protein
MTDAELDWLTCPAPLLLLEQVRGKVSDRKLRLFACGCCRLIWHLPDQPVASHRAVEIAERYSDGLSGEEERAAAERQAWDAWYPDEADDRGKMGFMAVAAFANTTGRTHHDADPQLGTWECVRDCIQTVLWIGGREDEEGRFEADRDREFRNTVATLALCVFGNPFRPVAFSPAWRTDTAKALARRMYDARDFSAMPILADALQDAECDNDDILNHCRADGPHARGCWVVDCVLGRE